MELMRSLLLKSDFYYIRMFFLKHGHLSWENSVVSKFTGILFILSALNTPLDNSDSSLFDVGKKGFFIVRDDIQTLSIGIRKVCMHLETK